MKNSADLLNEKIVAMQSPIVVGLDPVLDEIPMCYKQGLAESKNKFETIADILFSFNKDIIDIIYKYVPAIKPQMAFYEMYGSSGIIAVEKTVEYAKSKGMVIIEDGKRNDIGNTAEAYAKAYLGYVDVGNGEKSKSFDVDFLTVSPYLGSDSTEPFIKQCIENNKGVFVLVKTSNPSSAEIQDIVGPDGTTICESVAQYVAQQAERTLGEGGYSSVGAVVGATFPEEAEKLREIMPKSIFLVPGYGAQGGTAKDIVNCFNNDGLGAIINSSRGIIFSYKKKYSKEECTKEQYMECVEESVKKMQQDIFSALKDAEKLPRI